MIPKKIQIPSISHCNAQNDNAQNGNAQTSNAETGKISLWLLIPSGIIALTLIVYILFANSILRGMAESAIGDAAGAEANIESVDHSIFPFGIALTKLQVTDNAAPSQNKIAFDYASADVDLMPLLSGKVIIENLVAQNVAFGTERASAGDVYRAADASNSFAFPTLEDLPSVDEVLANSPLKTTAAVAQAQQTYAKYDGPLQEKYDTLPSKEKLAEYKERVEAFKNMDFKDPAKIAKATAEFAALKEDIKKDRDKVESFVALAQKAKVDMATSISALKTAPQEDYALLQGLVAGDEAAIGQVTQHLFGEKAELYTKALVVAADMLLNSAPADSEAETGVDSYPELPNIWIKNADISVKWLDESLSSTWANITDQHAKVNAPTTFSIASSNAQNWQAFNLNGELEILNGMVSSAQSWDIKGVVLKDLALIPADAQQKLTAVLNSGLLNSQGALSISSNQLSGESRFDLSNLKLSAQGANDLTNTIAAVLDEQTSMQLIGIFGGSLLNPSVSIKSDLDAKLLSSLGAGLANSPKLAELKQKLNAKAAAQLGTNTDKLDAVQSLLDAAKGDTDALTELLNAQIADKKEDVLNKLKNKLFN